MELHFICNVCQQSNRTKKSLLHRELPSCSSCSSTIRVREIVHVFESLPKEKRPVVIGLSDNELVASYMSKAKVEYLNTFYEKEPMLDVNNPVGYRDSADVLISSDVVEHVMYPFEKSLKGHFEILKGGGYLILTTPYFAKSAYLEKYPWMINYFVDEQGTVHGEGIGGEKVIVDSPIFHGGPGNTLEMRLFTPEILLAGLLGAGFIDVKFLEQDIPELGIFRSATQMGTIVAKKPKSFKRYETYLRKFSVLSKVTTSKIG